MHAAVKFCGLTRPEDARKAGELGAAYGGVIFAGGPRLVTDDAAAEIFASLPAGVKRVGVMGEKDARPMEERARRLHLDVVQMHSDPSPAEVRRLADLWDGEIWAVVRSADIANGDAIVQLFSCAHAVLVDAGSRGTHGGTGRAFDWESLARLLGVRGRGRLVLAGGLTSGNVGEAVRILRPDVVDVSSGVERSAGVKDHLKMQAFITAVRTAAGDRGGHTDA